MILPPEAWMDLRRYRPLLEAGASLKEIAAELGVDPRTVKKYLNGPGVPPQAPRRIGTQPRKIEHLAPVVDAWLAADIALRASVIHERLVAEHGFDGSYQRVKLYVAEARPRIAAEHGLDTPLSGLHRRFETVAGAQAQVDWGTESRELARALGVRYVYSFHMTLSYSRDPFCCFTTSVDLSTFWGCHARAFAHFGGVPGAIVYDRTKTVVRRHVAPGQAVPIHPEAAAFADHYGFAVDVVAARRPQAKGRVERQVLIVREHVLAGRAFTSLADLDAAFTAWLPTRRAQVHRTHGQRIVDRAETDRAALRPLPDRPYLVVDRHLRRVGKDCLVSFESSRYSVPATAVRAGTPVELRVGPDRVAIHAIGADPVLLADHHRARGRGDDQIDPSHWDGLPDGSTRATTTGPGQPGHDAPAAGADGQRGQDQRDVPLPMMLELPGLGVPVARRDLGVYDTVAVLPAQRDRAGGAA
jgi:transposase